MNLCFRWLVSLVVLGIWGAVAQGYEEFKSQGEALIQRGEFAAAHALYERIATNNLPETEWRWVLFRRDDSGWRMREAENLPKLEEVAPELARLGAADLPAGQRDRVWAEAQEAIGDFHWQRRDEGAWIQSRYGNALGWWARQTNLAFARDRYLGVVRKLELPPGWPGQRSRNWGVRLPDDILENSLAIAEVPADVAPLRLLHALRVGRRADAPSVVRAELDFERALTASTGIPGRDVVLWLYGQWREHSGRLVALPEGKWRVEADLEGAVKLYRQLESEFASGTSPWQEPARARIADLTLPAVTLVAPGTFLPGSEAAFYVSGRNVNSLVVTLRKVELGRDLKLPAPGPRNVDWKAGIGATGPVVEELSVSLAPASPHSWIQKRVVMPKPLPAGAYLVDVSGHGKSAQELLLITDAVVVVQAGARQVVAWVVDAMSGRPQAGSAVRIAGRWQGAWSWRSEARVSDENGLAVFDLAANSEEVLVLAGQEGHQALAGVWTGPSGEEAAESWRIYAFTDRPAYRPGDRIEWKFTARKQVQGEFTTPVGSRLGYELSGPQGEIVTNGWVTLNSFGSAWGGLALNATAGLGTYSARFFVPGKPDVSLGAADLFRLEEYRLPEFEVSVTPPEEKGPDGTLRPTRLRAGEPIRVTIAAKYYFGGPVAGGQAEVTVQKNPFNWRWPVPFEFPWLFPDSSEQESWRGSGDEVKREKVALNEQGRAQFTFDPGPNATDAEYVFTAAVTDAARREVRGERTVRATLDGYAVQAEALNRLPRPGDAVRIEFRARDANEQPVTVTGDVKITRNYWWEVWLDSFGRQVSGDELKKRRAESPLWPPKVEPGMKDWTLQSQGYRSDAVLNRRVATATNGVGEIQFTPEREGYFQIEWESPDVWAIAGAAQAVTNRIRAECAVWATSGAQDLGYRTEGLELLVDRESFRVGEKAPVMVVTANPGRWVWLSQEAGGIVGQQVFQMAGTTRLIALEVTPRMVPNFELRAASVADARLLQDARPVGVPPVRNFLNVEVIPGQTENRPGGEGRLTVTTRDWDGKPVPAEVALSVVDESVFYIQAALAPDPRQFFFGERRPAMMNLSSSFDRGGYQRLIRGRDGALREESADGRPRNLTPLPAEQPLDLERVVITGSLAPTTLAETSAMPNAAGVRLAFADAAGATRAKTKGSGGEPENAVVVRRDFRATAFWQPDVKTDGDGRAAVSFRYPDSTTRWLVRGVGETSGNQFGLGTNSTVTRSPLVVRLQSPRFLIRGDSAVISANLNNNSEAIMTVAASLAAEGVVVAGLYQDGRVVKGESGPVTVPPDGEARVDWQVQADQVGEAKLTVTARSATESDAMERVVPVFDYGLPKLIAHSGKATDGVTVHLDLPTRRSGPLDVTISVTPSLAATMLDALPFLADYPYGCTEQTLSRFLPAVIVRKTLREVGLDVETVMNRAFGGISTNAAGLFAPGLGGRKDLLKLDDMVTAGLRRLYGFQHGNGSWGWWAEGPDDTWMTAYVVWGLRLAQSAGVEVEEERLTRADLWLADQLVGLENMPDRAAWVLHALAAGRQSPGRPPANAFERRAFERAFARRNELNAYSQALLARAAQRLGMDEAAQSLAAALAASAGRDEAPDTSVSYGGTVKGGSTGATAHWGRTDQSWRWSDNGVEATALAAQALLAITPQNPQIEPAVTWLLKNRRGASWSNTRATAITLLALTDYLRVSGELKAGLSFEIRVNGRKIADQVIKPGEALAAPVKFAVPEAALSAGTNAVEIVRTTGTAPMYFAVEARFFSQETPVTPAASDLFVRRDYFRLVPVATLLEGVVDDRVPLHGGEGIASGDRLEARIVVETRNDLEYLMIEDLKPAGIEALEVQSGYRLDARELAPAGIQKMKSRPDAELLPDDFTGREERLYVEWRDRRAATFASRLPAGVWEIRIPYRAETPGRYAALPAVGEAMYAPEIRGNSASQSFEVREAAR